MGEADRESKTIALITPTGARPNQFRLCSHWMEQQTYKGNVLWIIIDDANPLTTEAIGESFKHNWTIVKIHPSPIWRGENTQARNIKCGIDFIKERNKNNEIDAIFFIEDDDFYRCNYIERMVARFDTVKVLGEMNTVYYNVYYRNYFVNRNTSHVSLFQLAIRPEMIPLFETCYNERFIDFKFFEKLHAQEFVGRGEVGMFNENNLAIGMKGMPGRGGIGAGHGKLMNMLPDANMIWLRNQIQDDAKYYEGYYGYNSQSQHATYFGKSN
jgi:hypothetical protein